MSRIHTSGRFLSFMIYQLILLPVASPPTPASAAGALEEAPQASFSIYFPLIRLGHPIADRVREVDYDRLMYQAQVVTEQFGPRLKDFTAPYIDDQCTFGMPSPDGKDNLTRSLEYASAYFQALGYLVSIEIVPRSDEYNGGGYNVLATRYGALYPNKYIEVGAHIDSHPGTPGASDNASGVAAVLEIARVLRDYMPNYSIRYAFFVGEEVNRAGSLTHTKTMKKQDVHLKAALILDSIGWSEIAPQSMNCIFDNGSSEGMRIAGLFDQARRDYNIDIDWRRCGEEGGQTSDNQSYWDFNYQAVLSVGGLPYLAPTYHRCSDAMNNLDRQNVFRTTQQNLAVLMMLDSDVY
jgi:hypothetical protein